MGLSRIGVLSDTHGALPEAVFRLFNGEWDDEELTKSIATAVDVIPSTEGAVGLEPSDPACISAGKCDLILHAGDIGPQGVLDELGAITRTVAVLGNNDIASFWCSDGAVRDYASLTFDGVSIFMQHIPSEMLVSLRGRPPLRPALVSTQPDLAIHGHTHVPRLDCQAQRITLCPGSPTRARNGSGHGVALVDIEDGHISHVALVRLL